MNASVPMTVRCNCGAFITPHHEAVIRCACGSEHPPIDIVEYLQAEVERLKKELWTIRSNRGALRAVMQEVADGLDRYGSVIGAHEEVNVQTCVGAFHRYASILRDALAAKASSD